MKENKNHWYDGIFYDVFIAPNQDKSFRLAKSIIKENSTVIDAGCGTGRFAFTVADKVNKVDAVDLSERNIKVAMNKLTKNNSPKIKFYHSDIYRFFENGDKHYDYAVMSYVIHEVDEHLRNDILKTLSENADKVILIDYLHPRPKNYWSWLNEAVEFAAGKEHYTNFKSYLKNSGLRGLAERSGLKIIKEIKNTPSTSHIVVLEK
ncbi:MAG: class I SAM-dependent methyltransferase [Melioribacteraceae bacterium]|nr:class I SAM-dependent methyltransferase [Melioribacteraceae bacterium]